MSHSYTKRDNGVCVNFTVDILRTTDAVIMTPTFIITFVDDQEVSICATNFVLCMNNHPNHYHRYSNSEHITHLRENGRMQYSYVTEANVYEIDYRFMIEKTESDDLYFNISGIVTKKTDGTEGPTFEETYFMQL